jgi:hypothetical protein
VAEAVVDRLEVIEVQQQHRHAVLPAPVGRQGRGDLLDEVGPVGQRREGIGEGLDAQFLLQLPMQGHVPEAPDPPDRDPVDPLRLGVTLEEPAVQELDLVMAALGRHRPELGGLPGELLRMHQLVEHRVLELRVVSGGQHGRVDPPHVQELLVVAQDPPARVDHQDPVGGGVQGRFQQRHRQRHPGVLGGSQHRHRGQARRPAGQVAVPVLSHRQVRIVQAHPAQQVAVRRGELGLVARRSEPGAIFRVEHTLGAAEDRAPEPRIGLDLDEAASGTADRLGRGGQLDQGRLQLVAASHPLDDVGVFGKEQFGALAGGDVVEQSVLNRSLTYLVQQRVIEHPDDLAVAADHSVFHLGASITG